MDSIKDILKKSFLEGYNASDISLKTVVVALALTAVIAMYIFFLYRIMVRKTFYSKNFNIALVGVALITAAVVITIQSSIVVSLGMVGALSIVRFRTAIKDPMDLMYLFWAISTGIICGAGFAEYAVVLAIVLTIVVLVLNYFPIVKAPMILVVNSSNLEIEGSIVEKLKQSKSYYNIKSRNITHDSIDFTVEVRTKEGAKLVKEIMALEGVESAALLEHDGEATF